MSSSDNSSCIEGSPEEDALLAKTWKNLRKRYFPDNPEIDNYRIFWSNRKQSRSLATCHYIKHKVLVAHAMSLPECSNYLEPLLYHEMCHAALGKPKIKKGRRVLHGKDFYALEKRHPGVDKLNTWIHEGGWNKAVRTWNRKQGQLNRRRKRGKAVVRPTVKQITAATIVEHILSKLEVLITKLKTSDR